MYINHIGPITGVTVAIGNTSAVLIAGDVDVRAVYIRNSSSDTVWLSTEDTATIANSFAYLKTDESFEFTGTNLFKGKITAITASGTSNVVTGVAG